MKIIITGAKGMLGQALARAFNEYNLFLYDRDELDITDLSAVRRKLSDIQPDVVINAAAYAAVDECENQRELALKVNGEGPGNLAQACKQIGAILVHYSTDYIFNGLKEDGYSEDYAEIQPINIYGESKALGEKLIKDNSQKYYILRTAWLYGTGGNNFVDTMLKLGREKPELKVVDDQHGSPTYTLDLAARTKQILTELKPDYGTYHCTNAGDCTWYEFTQEIFRQEKITTKLLPCTSAEFPRPAIRPQWSILLNTKLPAMRDWRQALQDYLESNNCN